MRKPGRCVVGTTLFLTAFLTVRNAGRPDAVAGATQRIVPPKMSIAPGDTLFVKYILLKENTAIEVRID